MRVNLRVLVLGLSIAGLLLIAQGTWIPVKAHIAQILLEHAWQTGKITGRTQKPWPWADSWPVAHLTIPSIGLEAIILKEAGGEGLAFGPVHLSRSATLGEVGTSVIAAHRDTHFRKLANLEKGAILNLEIENGQRLAYQVTTMRIARWDRSGLIRDSLKDQLVLSSCWPFDALKEGPLRFIAIATPVAQTSAMITGK